MNNILSIKRTKNLDFPRDEVWNVITAPKLFKWDSSIL